jgi:tetratricopeptide (TPR) repeat protein
MTGNDAFEVRLGLAQGHWEIGEYEEALRCLERALEEPSDDPQDPRLGELASRLVGELSGQAGAGASEDLRTRLYRVLEAASASDELSGSIATPTLAELLAEQGHAEKALRVAEDVLRKNPEDTRARAVRERLQPSPPSAHPEARPESRRDGDAVIAELERWLGNLRRRGAEQEARA